MAELRCERVAKSYGARTVLSDVDLVVAEGTLTAILGASGSGKTTLLRVIIGFIRADGGRVLVSGTPVADGRRLHLPPEKRAIGYVAQEGALYPHLSVRDNVNFGLPRAERRGSSRIGEVLELVGLSDAYADRRPHELSGGEQRRVALARALAPRPRLVLLDEPFSALDAALRVDTRGAVLRHALSESGTTAVLVTHDQSEALSMGREVAVLRAGRLVQTAPPSTLYRRPADLDVARFVGEAVVLPGRLSSGIVCCTLGMLPVADGAVEGPVQVMVRPEQIRMSPAGGPSSASSSGDSVTGHVVSEIYYGPDTMVRVALDGDDGTVVPARSFSHEAPQTGDRVGLAVSGPVVVYPAATGPGGDTPLVPEPVGPPEEQT